MTPEQFGMLLADKMKPIKVFHYFAPERTKPPYTVWAIDSAGNERRADNMVIERAREGTIDYYTSAEYDDTPVKIERILNIAQISNRSSSEQFEKDTGLIHYEWIFQI